MIKKTCWDQSLIKKYSSSNHFKLLNQLRNEVIKYPLNKKKNIQSSMIRDNKFEGNNKLIKEINQDSIFSKNYNIKKEVDNKMSNVSFNNSKNFSIYNNSNTDTTKKNKDNSIPSIENSDDDFSSSTFNDRLNNIDLK